MKWTLPNILTLLRLAAAPGVAVMFLYFNRPWADLLALTIFILAAITDWFDGYIARAWNQETKFGTMLDPIADKAMVVIALLVITGYSGMDPWLILPTTVILFREVFVSGLREFLGTKAGLLRVTKLAKWKTTTQMVAIAVLFLGTGLEYHESISSHVLRDGAYSLDASQDIFSVLHICGEGACSSIATRVGLGLIWIAALLTFITGWDYFYKSLPYLKDDSR